jgi:hypothetical protein
MLFIGSVAGYNGLYQQSFVSFINSRAKKLRLKGERKSDYLSDETNQIYNNKNKYTQIIYSNDKRTMYQNK